MPKPLFIASKNEHKIEEIRAIFSNINLDVRGISNLTNIPDVIEDGKTFLDNALLKAEHYHQYTKAPVMADDSGLVVPALNGSPGIYSARYAGEHADYAANNRKLLADMHQYTGNQRNAFFICQVVFKDGNIILSARGEFHGKIAEQESGEYGFGYDPLFFLPERGCTLAEIQPVEKNTISHRAIAFRLLAQKVEAFLSK